MSGERKKKDDKFYSYEPIRSHVCSFAVLSLWIMFVGGPDPFGTAVATAGEIAFGWADPFETGPGVVGMVEEPLMWGGWGWDGWETRLWGWGWRTTGGGGGGGSCIRTSRSCWRGRCLWDMGGEGKMRWKERGRRGRQKCSWSIYII